MGCDALGRPRRRTVLRALAGGTLATIAGCTVLGTEHTTETAKLTPVDGDAGDLFGASVALAGDTALIGAPEDKNPNSGEVGAAYVLARGDDEWTETAKLTPAAGGDKVWFGGSVALEGETALIGAPRGGYPHVFERADGEWIETAQLAPTHSYSMDDFFGDSVALAGETALIGHESGTYIFERTANEWAKEVKLAPVDFNTDGDFGHSVALADDTILIGAPEGDDPNEENTGVAYVFERVGSEWTQTASLAAADGDEEDKFGFSVALTADGDTALVGAPYDEGPTAEDEGAAYVFERAVDGWTEAAKLTPTDGEDWDRFGKSVALAGDTALIGAPYDEALNGAAAGAAYVFQQTSDGWTEVATLVPADGDKKDRFGLPVALADDGDTALIGAFRDDEYAGAAYVFDL